MQLGWESVSAVVSPSPPVKLEIVEIASVETWSSQKHTFPTNLGKRGGG